MLLRRRTDWPSTGWTSPFKALESMRRQMDWLSSGLSRGVFGETSASVFPLMNISEDKDNFYVHAELPGLKADDLEISVTGDSLSIAGERMIPAEDEKAQYHRREREAGRFSRIVTLPAQVNTDKVEATCTDGVLAITLAKSEVSKPKQIAVKAS